MKTSGFMYTAALCIIAGVALGLLFTCNHTGNIVPVAPVKELVKAASASDRQYTKIADSLHQHEQVLQARLESTFRLLAKAKKENAVLAGQVVSLAAAQHDQKDTVQTLSNCDSLQSKVALYVSSNDTKDSLYETVIDNQYHQISVKDSLYHAQELRYQQLDHLFSQSLLQQQLLEDQQKKASKAFRRQQFKTKLLAGCMVFAAGMATHFLSK